MAKIMAGIFGPPEARFDQDFGKVFVDPPRPSFDQGFGQAISDPLDQDFTNFGETGCTEPLTL